MSGHSRKNYRCFARHHVLALGPKTLLMGIINMTPDSFSRDGCLRVKKHTLAHAYDRALNMIRHGADILDIGGESTRPGAARVDAAEETRRIIPLIRRLAQNTSVPISADTNKVSVAKAALDAGAAIINTIKGANPSQSLLRMVARYDAGIVLMHIAGGTPRTMQERFSYKNDIMNDIIYHLKLSIEKCLENGIKSDRIIVDPGIGFGKSVEHNLRIINQLHRLKVMSCPILIGPSRKSFIGYILGQEVPSQRLFGTAATVTASILNGAHIIRVHDVEHMDDIRRMTDAIRDEKAEA